MAMLIVMTLYPLVYALLQHRNRQGFQTGERFHSDHKREVDPTANPTLGLLQLRGGPRFTIVGEV